MGDGADSIVDRMSNPDPLASMAKCVHDWPKEWCTFCNKPKKPGNQQVLNLLSRWDDERSNGD